MSSPWLVALKEYSTKTGKPYKIYKKGTKEHEQVLKIYNKKKTKPESKKTKPEGKTKAEKKAEKKAPITINNIYCNGSDKSNRSNKKEEEPRPSKQNKESIPPPPPRPPSKPSTNNDDMPSGNPFLDELQKRIKNRKVF